MLGLSHVSVSNELQRAVLYDTIKFVALWMMLRIFVKNELNVFLSRGLNRQELIGPLRVVRDELGSKE